MKLVYGEKRENKNFSKRNLFNQQGLKRIWKKKDTKWEEKWKYSRPASSRKKKKNRSTKDYVIILKSVIRKQRRENKKTYFM